ncbi:transcription antitermination factor NusB [Candidatus Peribacteria bacterium]|nr:transcription antitermination factor NusB [Candidatus Peribacteria bacterium]
MRRRSRIIAMQALFAYTQREETVAPEECYQHVVACVNEGKQSVFAHQLYTLTLQHYKKMRVVLRAYASQFSFEKIAPINRAILLCGLTEMKYMETPALVVINEYIEIAKDYGEVKSASFVNGVLDSFRANIGKSTDTATKEPDEPEVTEDPTA